MSKRSDHPALSDVNFVCQHSGVSPGELENQIALTAPMDEKGLTRHFRIPLKSLVSLALLVVAVLPMMAHAQAEATSYKLDFTDGALQAGFAHVQASDIYNDARGYGFEPTRRMSDKPTAKGTVSGPFYFSVHVLEGNYKVTVQLGDPAGESETTIKAELRRLMLQDVKTQSGQVVTRSFIVNVRTPKYPGGEVKLKEPRESKAEAWAWDEKLTLEINGKRPALRTIDVEKVDVPTVFILGDSTVCDQSGEPYASWGQMLPRFFKPDIAVANHAESGETVRSSTGAHRFDKVMSQMKAGDYLLMQYGHNDMKSKAADAGETYENGLKQWCDSVKAKGGIPVLVTPMNRHSFEGDVVTNSLGEYPGRVRDAAKAEDVTLIDLNAMSKPLYESFGPTASIQLFEHAEGSNKFDHTHHSDFGAYELARCVIEGIRQSHLDLAKHIADDVPPFDPAKPDEASAVIIPFSPSAASARPLGD